MPAATEDRTLDEIVARIKEIPNYSKRQNKVKFWVDGNKFHRRGIAGWVREGKILMARDRYFGEKFDVNAAAII